MKLFCNQKDLANAINVVQRAVSSKTTLPILKGILLEAYDHKLKLTGNDMNIGIETYINANIETEGSIVLSSRLFGEIIRKLPNALIEIEILENATVVIRCEKSEFTLVGQGADEFPNIPEVNEENSYKLDHDLLKDMIRQTIFAISQDETRPILTGSLVEIEDGKLTMVSIDGYRLAIRKAQIKSEQNNRAVVPGKTLNETLKILSGFENNNDVKISFTDKHILFSMENVKVVSRLLEGEFINYSQIEPKECKSKVTVNLSEFSHGIERASLLARESKNSSIKLAIKDDLITITSTVEVGSAHEEVKIKLDGQDIEIGFNPKYILDALKVIDSEDIQIELTTSVSPCVMKPLDSENYVYIVLPVRMAN